MKRQLMKPSIDSKVFRNTAVKSKKCNIRPVSYRGGTRM